MYLGRVDIIIIIYIYIFFCVWFKNLPFAMQLGRVSNHKRNVKCAGVFAWLGLQLWQASQKIMLVIWVCACAV